MIYALFKGLFLNYFLKIIFFHILRAKFRTPPKHHAQSVSQLESAVQHTPVAFTELDRKIFFFFNSYYRVRTHTREINSVLTRFSRPNLIRKVLIHCTHARRSQLLVGTLRNVCLPRLRRLNLEKLIRSNVVDESDPTKIFFFMKRREFFCFVTNEL